VDFSEFSHRAFRYAVSLARHFGSRLFIQHTVEPPQYLLLEGVGPGVVKDSPEKQLHTSREAIRRMLISNKVDSSEVTVLLNQGNIAVRILETIVEEPIALVVMGTHGRKGFNRFMLGSVTEGIIHQAACPVLVISQPEKEIAVPGMEEFRLRTILLATDFSGHSDQAVTYAIKWGCEWSSRVVIHHTVQETPSSMRGIVDLFPEFNPYFERQLARAWKEIRHLVPEQAQQRCEVACDVRHGNPKEEILRVADEKSADLIIMGARGTDGSTLPWGSVSSAVVRDGRFPVLVVRKPAP
jgi:nucleotide-binding universal stress UspA family protein